MTNTQEHITQEQALTLAKTILHDNWNPSDWFSISPDQVHTLLNAAIQHYKDYARQAIANDRAKQNTRAPMFKFRECEDSQAGACELEKRTTVQPFHESASHINPDYRDGWNAAVNALEKQVPPARSRIDEAIQQSRVDMVVEISGLQEEVRLLRKHLKLSDLLREEFKTIATKAIAKQTNNCGIAPGCPCFDKQGEQISPCARGILAAAQDPKEEL